MRIPMTFKKMSPVRSIIKKIFLCFMLLSFLSACAAAGPKFIDLAYVKHHSPTQKGKVGLSRFEDKRQKTEKGYVGRRILTDKSRETYQVRGQNLSATLTELTRVYLEKTGFVVTPIAHWPRNLGALGDAPGGLAHILSADINILECRAEKKGVYTHMVLEMSLTFYLGDISSKRLSTIPASLTLERTELTFTPKKLEQFINQAFEEIVEKAFPFS